MGGFRRHRKSESIGWISCTRRLCGICQQRLDCVFRWVQQHFQTDHECGLWKENDCIKGNVFRRRKSCGRIQEVLWTRNQLGCKERAGSCSYSELSSNNRRYFQQRRALCFYLWPGKESFGYRSDYVSGKWTFWEKSFKTGLYAWSSFSVSGKYWFIL